MTEWRTVSVGDIAEPDRYGVAGGPFGSALGRKDYVTDGVPVIRGAQLGGPGDFSHEDLVFVSQSKADAHRGNLAFPGDVVVTQRGTVGQIGRIPDHAPYPRYLLSQSQMKLTVDPRKSDSRFVYYALLSPKAQQALHGATMSAGVPHINLATFRDLELRLPSLPTQRIIAAFLGNLDDLIENNRRRIELLEKLAQAIYREWFVCFRYPGHTGSTPVDSAVGQIPEGWSIRTLADVADARRGLSWNRSSESDSSLGTRVVTIPNIGRRLHFVGCTRLADVSPRDLDRFSLRQGDILLIGSNGNPARVGQSVRVPWDSDAVFASFIMRVRADPTKTSPTLLFHQLGDGGGVVESMRASAVGSTGLRNVRISALRDAQIVVPDVHVRQKFDEAVAPAQATADLLNQEATKLVSMRDLLLPRLVSGQIDVSDLDLEAGGVSGA